MFQFHKTLAKEITDSNQVMGVNIINWMYVLEGIIMKNNTNWARSVDGIEDVEGTSCKKNCGGKKVDRLLLFSTDGSFLHIICIVYLRSLIYLSPPTRFVSAGSWCCL